jgi:MFS family permease
MFAVGWGANQFSPLLVVYRHNLGLSAAALAGLFAIYAAPLIPGLLVGGPLSDRIGRRPVVIPLVVASPVASLLFMADPRSLAVIAAGRALAGLCSGVVFGSATAWVQELSDDPAVSARRSAVALSAGFGLGPAVASVLAQWAPDPLVLAYLPHVIIGAAAVAVIWRAPETATGHGGGAGRQWPPRAVRSRRFWLAVAPAAPWVFGSAALAFVVLPQEVIKAGSLSVGFAGLITAATVGGALAVQPLARRLEAHWRLAGNVAGLACAAAAAGLGIGVVATSNRLVAVACAIMFGFTYGLCLVSGLREAERLADPGEHGAVVACFYTLTYLGFAVPYLVDGVNTVLGRTGTFVALAIAATLVAAFLAAYTARSPEPGPGVSPARARAGQRRPDQNSPSAVG